MGPTGRPPSRACYGDRYDVGRRKTPREIAQPTVTEPSQYPPLVQELIVGHSVILDFYRFYKVYFSDFLGVVGLALRQLNAAPAFFCFIAERQTKFSSLLTYSRIRRNADELRERQPKAGMRAALAETNALGVPPKKS